MKNFGKLTPNYKALSFLFILKEVTTEAQISTRNLLKQTYDNIHTLPKNKQSLILKSLERKIHSL
jgi:hypothetical protein